MRCRFCTDACYIFFFPFFGVGLSQSVGAVCFLREKKTNRWAPFSSLQIRPISYGAHLLSFRLPRIARHAPWTREALSRLHNEDKDGISPSFTAKRHTHSPGRGAVDSSPTFRMAWKQQQHASADEMPFPPSENRREQKVRQVLRAASSCPSPVQTIEQGHRLTCSKVCMPSAQHVKSR